MPRQALLESLMRALDSCVEAEPDIGDSAVSSRKIEVFPGRLLEEKRVFYLRADGLTEETLSGAKDEILQSLTASPAAMILDLRNASSGDSEDEFAHVIRFLGLLTEESKISPWYSSRPFAVLISGKTSGAAALLASLLVPSFAEAFTVGEATSGSCFPSVTETACGFRWHFPWIPEVLADTKTPTGPLEPVFRVPGTSGQIDFRKLGDEQSVSADKVLRTALDLTISLSVLKDRGPSAAK